MSPPRHHLFGGVISAWIDSRERAGIVEDLEEWERWIRYAKRAESISSKIQIVSGVLLVVLVIGIRTQGKPITALKNYFLRVVDDITAPPSKVEASQEVVAAAVKPKKEHGKRKRR